MLEVQNLLRYGTTLDCLQKDLGIRATKSPCGRLVILNYDQIESPKLHPVVRECRGLTLEMGRWDVVARAFPRFYNWSEVPAEDELFDWDSAVVQEKCDGSLILVYGYDGEVRVNTRGSFGDGFVNDTDIRWSDLFWKTGIDRDAIYECLSHNDITLVFELCSPFNKVVRRYEKPTAYLLSIFENRCFIEEEDAVVDIFATHIGAQRPRVYSAKHKADLDRLLAGEADPTFEGFVVRDAATRRVKVKSARYVALHHLKGEGNSLFAPKRLVPFILGGAADKEELLLHFPEVADKFARLMGETARLRSLLGQLWEANKGAATQKEFALGVLNGGKTEPILAGMLFECRRDGRSPEEVWQERAADVLMKYFDKQKGALRAA